MLYLPTQFRLCTYIFSGQYISRGQRITSYLGVMSRCGEVFINTTKVNVAKYTGYLSCVY